MDILNFINWIAGKKRVVKTLPGDSLVPVGIRTEQRGDKYTTVGITVADLLSGVTPPGVALVEIYDTYSDFPTKGNDDHLYVTKDSNLIYRYDSALNTYPILNDPDIVNPDAPEQSQTYYVRLATNGPLSNCNYYNGVGNDGVGATLTGTGPLGQSNSPGLIDTKVPAVGNTILVKNETSKLRNGIYEVTQLNPFILTRIEGYNEPSEIYPSIVFVSEGASNINRYFSQSTASVNVGVSSLVYGVAATSQSASPVLFIDAVFTSNLTATYTNGTVYPVTVPGYGAKLTGTGPIGTSNGVTLKSNDRVIVNGQTNPAHNGSYIVTNAGSGTQNWVLTRWSSDSSAFYKIREYVVNNPNSTIFGSRWTISSPLTMLNSAWGTTGITFTQNNAGGGSEFTYTEVTVSSAEILNMASSPVVLLPSPAANSYYDLEKMIIEYTAGSNYYSHVLDDSITIYQGFQYRALIHKSFIGFIHVNRKASTVINDFTGFQANTYTDLSDRFDYGNIDGDSVTLSTYNQGVNYTGGNGTFLIKIWYKLRTFGTEL